MAKPRKGHSKPKSKKQSPPATVKATLTKAEATKSVRFNSPIDEGDRARFHHHLPKVVSLRDAVATATSNLRNAYKSAKADGFTKADFDYAVDVATPEKEASTKEKIRRRLLVAKWMGSDLGSQLDLFSNPDYRATEPLSVVARAYEEGQTASMQNKAAKPDYAPGTETYAQYMEGFHSHQAAIVKAKASKTADKYTKPKVPKAQNGGFGMSEDEFAAEQARAAPALATHGLDEDDAPL